MITRATITLDKTTKEGSQIIDYTMDGLEPYEDFLLRVIAELEDELKANKDG